MLTVLESPAGGCSTLFRQNRMVLVMVCALGSIFVGCMPDPDRSLARYQREALAYAEAEAAAYGAQWEAGLAGLWTGVRAAVVHVGSVDADGIYHDLSPALEQEWSTRWPGLVPLRTSRSANDTLLILLAPQPLAGEDDQPSNQVLIQAQLFLGGDWSTHSIAIAPNAEGGWEAVGEVSVAPGTP